VYGVAIYTGHDSKVMMNSSKNKPKFSKIEVATNKYIRIGVFIQMCICIVAAILNSLWEYVAENHNIDAFYLELNHEYNFLKKPPVLEEVNRSILISVPINFGKWFLAMMNFVSISLLVTLEMIKFC
jgi:hypothetical protein